jgi:hypothetical protein
MRQDQYERIQGLTEQLADVFISEADPTKWPGATIPVDMQDKTIRGDRYWMKKNAVATMALMQRISSFVDVIQRRQLPIDPELPPGEEGEEVSVDKEIDRYETQAQQLIKQMQSQTGKASYDKRVHGK